VGREEGRERERERYEKTRRTKKELRTKKRIRKYVVYNFVTHLFRTLGFSL
jgi:hypothetical protein